MNWNGICHRCGAKTNTFTMSMYNLQLICMQCKSAETRRDDYDKAVQADHAEIKKGNYNFKGIGLETDFMDLVRRRSMTSQSVMQFLKGVGDWKEVYDGDQLVALTFVHRFEQASENYTISHTNKYFHNACQIMRSRYQSP